MAAKGKELSGGIRDSAGSVAFDSIAVVGSSEPGKPGGRFQGGIPLGDKK
jgi:hypothetical protein